MPQRCVYLVKGRQKSSSTYTTKGSFKKAVRAGKEAAWRYGKEFDIIQRCMLPAGRHRRTKMAVCYPVRGTRHTECLYVRRGKKRRVL